MKGAINALMKARILEETPVLISFQDTEQNILWANKAYRVATGLAEDEIVGKKCFIAWGLTGPCQNCPVISALKTGLPAEAELTPESQPHWPKSRGNWLSGAVPLTDENGQIVGAIEVAIEITAQKASEQRRLKDTEDVFMRVLDNSIYAVIMTDDQGRVTYWNPAAEKMFGYSASEMMGKKVHDALMPEEYQSRFKKGFETFQKTGRGRFLGKVVELTAKKKSGAKISIELSLSPLKKQGKHRVAAIIRDITAQKKAEEKISHQLRFFTALYETAQKLTEDLDLSQRAAVVVRRAVESFGCSLAWVGMAQKDGSVRHLAHYPEDITYPLDITVRWDETPEGQGPIGRAIRSGLPQTTSNIPRDPRFKPWKGLALKTGRIKSAAAFPLTTRGNIVGALNLYSDKTGFFTKGRVKEFTLFANLAAQSLETARLYDQTTKRMQRLMALRNIDLAITGSLDLRVVTRIALEEIVKQLGVDAAAILYLNPHTLRLEFLDAKGFRTAGIEKTSLSLTDSIAGRVVQECRIIHIQALSRADKKVFTRADLLKDEDFVAYYGAPLIAKGKTLGVLEVYQRGIHEDNSEWLEFFETLAGQVAIALENASLVDDLRHKHLELTKAYNETIEGWATALSLKEEETAEHSRRVTEMSLRIGKLMGMREEELYHLRLGALLHDIGKIGVPDSILLKPGKLTDEEWEIMRKHPVYGFEMLAPISYLRRASEVPYCHHEKWDGTGYPRRLKGTQIPLSARIFALADVWDALSSDRPYRKAWPKEKVIEYIREQSGSHFDPEVVECFLKIMEEDEELQVV